MAPESTPPFDRVVVTRNGISDELRFAEFAKLPLNERVGLILARGVAFYKGAELVDLQEALKFLRRRRG